MKHYCRLMAKLAIYSKVVIHHKILLMLSGWYLMCMPSVGQNAQKKNFCYNDVRLQKKAYLCNDFR